MELKLQKWCEELDSKPLLIVPYGIETSSYAE